MLAELERLHELGWRRSVFVVDDNFIGNKRDVKGFLRELQPWMEARGSPLPVRYGGLARSGQGPGADGPDDDLQLRRGVPRHRDA